MTGAAEITRLGAAGLATAALHLGLLVLVFVFGANEKDPADPPVELPVIQSELLKWGEEMPDERALPVIANPAKSTQEEPPRDEIPEPAPKAEPAPTETVALNVESAESEDQPEAELKAEVTERTPDAPPVPNRGETNPHRPTNEHKIQGSPEGFRSGTSLSESAIRNQLAQIQDQLQRAFRPPRSISDSELRSLEARFYLAVDATGRIVRWRLIRSSGNVQFDRTAEAAFNQFRHGDQRLRLDSISNEQLRQQIKDRGFETTMVGR